MPLWPSFGQATDFAASSVFFSASGVEMSGRGAPCLMPTPTPERAMEAREAPSTLPCFARSSMPALVRMARSKASPDSMSRLSTPARPHFTVILCPVWRSKAGASSSSAAFTPLEAMTLISAALLALASMNGTVSPIDAIASSLLITDFSPGGKTKAQSYSRRGGGVIVTAGRFSLGGENEAAAARLSGRVGDCPVRLRATDLQRRRTRVPVGALRRGRETGGRGRPRAREEREDLPGLPDLRQAQALRQARALPRRAAEARRRRRHREHGLGRPPDHARAVRAGKTPHRRSGRHEGGIRHHAAALADARRDEHGPRRLRAGGRVRREDDRQAGAAPAAAESDHPLRELHLRGK